MHHVAYFRLLRGAAQHGAAPGTAGSHQQREGRADAWQAQRKVHAMQRAFAPQRHGDALQLDLGPHGGQSGQMNIHRPRPQTAAAGQRQPHIPCAAEQRRKVKHRAAHCPGKGFRNLAAERLHRPCTQVRAAPPHIGPHGLQQRKAGRYIGKGRHLLQAAGSAAEQRGRQQRQRAVFGGRRADAPMQSLFAGNGDHLHERASPEEI